MCATKVKPIVLSSGRCPFNEWLFSIPVEAKIECVAAIKELEKHGHKLDRPLSDFLQDGIYELRIKHNRIEYRMLYFFAGKGRAWITHGFIKKTQKVPPEEIEKASRAKKGVVGK